MLSDEIIAALIESIPETVAVIVVAVLGWRQIHRVRMEINGRLTELLEARYAAGELQGRDDERARDDRSDS